MWGRLLMLAIGAAAGVLGKVFMDGYNNEGSTSSESYESSEKAEKKAAKKAANKAAKKAAKAAGTEAESADEAETED